MRISFGGHSNVGREVVGEVGASAEKMSALFELQQLNPVLLLLVLLLLLLLLVLLLLFLLFSVNAQFERALMHYLHYNR